MKYGVQLGAFGVVICAIGCAGGQFILDPALAKTPEMPVYGPLGFNAYECDPEHTPAPTNLGEDRPATIVLGQFSGTATPLRRELTTTKIFGETLAEDYRKFATQVRTVAEHLRDKVDVGEGKTSAEGGKAENPTVDRTLNAIQFVLSLPESGTETTGFGFAGQIEDRTLVAACRTTQSARVFGAFDGPQFVLQCRWESPQANARGDWKVEAVGSWSNYSFVGELKSEAGDVARFTSQNVTVLGMGGVRGFDWKTDQSGVAALSFWQRPGPRPANLPAGKEPPYEPRAWLSGSLESKPGFRDGVLISVALSYLFPWPSECDNKRIRAGAMKTAK